VIGRVRYGLLAALVLLLGGWRSTTSPVRPPTPAERTMIVRAAAETWNYESAPEYVYPALRRGRRRPRLRPAVIRIAVDRSDPRFASAVVELRDANGRRHGEPGVMVFKRGRSWLTDKPGANAIGGPSTAFSKACTPATPAGVRRLVCPDPWAVLRYPRPHIQAQTVYTQQIPSPDLHAVDWRRIALPGAVCGSSRPIRPSIHDHVPEAFVHADVDLVWWNPVWVYSWSKPVFGDLDGDGRDEAALGVVCANGGGTADGQLAFSEVVFQAFGRSLRVLGILTPRQSPFDPHATHVPLSHVAAIKRGEVVVSEAWYGDYDGTCCPSGRATTVWVYRHGMLSPARTMILPKPWSSPISVQDPVAEPGDRELQPAFESRATRIVARPGLHIVLTLSSFGPVKHNVKVTLTIRQSSSTIVRTKTVIRVPLTSSGNGTTVVFGHFGRLEIGKSTVTVSIQDNGAFPLRYPVTFTRG
jgi:hypothetical protein